MWSQHSQNITIITILGYWFQNMHHLNPNNLYMNDLASVGTVKASTHVSDYEQSPVSIKQGVW